MSPPAVTWIRHRAGSRLDRDVTVAGSRLCAARSMTPRVVAIGGGKGGVGKSLVAANVGIFLATLGKRVILVDAAFGAPNLHIFAGVPRPSRSLSEALVADGPPLAELAVATHVPGVRLIGGVYDPPWVASPAPELVRALAEQLHTLPADWVVVDLGPGLARADARAVPRGRHRLLVAVPDPTSIELMHRFVRRRSCAASSAAGSATSRTRRRAIRATSRAARRARSRSTSPRSQADAPSSTSCATRSSGFSPHLVINSARSKSDMELGRAVASAARRRLGTPIRYLGHLEYDEAVWASTRRRRPLLIEHPETRIAKCFERVARGLLAVRPPVDRRRRAAVGLALRAARGAADRELRGHPAREPPDPRHLRRRVDRDQRALRSGEPRGGASPARPRVHDADGRGEAQGVRHRAVPRRRADAGRAAARCTPTPPPPRPAAKVDDPATLAVRPPMPEISPRDRVLRPAAAPDPRGDRRRAARDRRALEDRHGVPAGARGRGVREAAGARSTCAASSPSTRARSGSTPSGSSRPTSTRYRAARGPSADERRRTRAAKS